VKLTGHSRSWAFSAAKIVAVLLLALLYGFRRYVFEHLVFATHCLGWLLIWILVAGWWLALMHLITGLLEAITIIGIPLALANWKMVPISLVPLGKQIVPSDRVMAAYGH